MLTTIFNDQIQVQEIVLVPSSWAVHALTIIMPDGRNGVDPVLSCAVGTTPYINK